MTSLRRNIPLLYGFSFLQMTLFPMAVITLFWKDHIGLSLSQILLLQSIFAVAMVVMEYPSGYISDRVGYRTALTLASVLGIAGWGVYTVASSFRDVLIAETLLGISTSFISGTDSALLYESLKETGDEAAYGRFEGRSTFFGQTGEAAGALFAGVLYARYPLLPFVLQVAVWVLALLLTRGMAEPPRERHHQVNHLKESLASARYVFIENRRLRVTVLLSIALGLSSFYPVWLIQPYMRNAGVPLASFGPIWAGANLTVAIFAVFSHRLREQLRDRGMIFLLIILVWGGYLGLGLGGGSVGISLLLPADGHAGDAGAVPAARGSGRDPVGQPGRDALAPVPLLPAAVRRHRPAPWPICRCPRGGEQLPAPLLRLPAGAAPAGLVVLETAARRRFPSIKAANWPPFN